MTKQATRQRRHGSPRENRPPKKAVVELNVELEFAPGVHVAPALLSEMVLDAISEYDLDNRLVPGAPPVPYGDRITGISVGFVKYEVTDAVWPTGHFVEPPGWKASEPTREALHQQSRDIEHYVYKLREEQARLMGLYEEFMFAETPVAQAVLEKRAKLALDRAAALIAGKGA